MTPKYFFAPLRFPTRDIWGCVKMGDTPKLPTPTVFAQNLAPPDVVHHHVPYYKFHFGVVLIIIFIHKTLLLTAFGLLCNNKLTVTERVVVKPATDNKHPGAQVLCSKAACSALRQIPYAKTRC